MRDGKKTGVSTTPLAKVADTAAPIVYGIVQPGPDISDGIPFVQSRDVGGIIDLSSMQRTSPEIAAKYRRSKIVPGDILFSLRGNIGQSSLAPNELDGANIARGIARIRVGAKSDTEFVRYVLQGSVLQKLISRNANGSTFRELSIEELRKLPIPDVSISEQRKIAAILRAWDEALEKLNALRSTKARRMDGVAQALLGPSRTIGPDAPPSNWSLSDFGELFEEREDRNSGLTVDDVVTVGKYAIRKQSEHFTRSVASKDLSNYRTIFPGDFVYDPMSAYYGAIGRYLGTSDGIVSPAYRVMRLLNGHDPDFIAALLKTHHIRFLLDTRSSQGNKEGKRRLLQRSEFESIEFRLPSKEVQGEIAHKLSVFQADLDLADSEIKALTDQKRGLMQKLLTGNWRVKVSDGEEAAA